MKYVFVILIFAHGIIHLFGFAKAFNLAQLEPVSMNVPKYQGIVWFVVFLLFTYTGEAYLSGNSDWYWPAFLAIVISTFLAIATWQDAKFGMIPNIIILLVALFSFSSTAFNKMIKKEIASIIKPIESSKSIIISKDQLNDLPYPVAKWLEVSGIIGKEKVQRVYITQKAKMKLKQGQKEWNKAMAEQYFAIETPTFIWKANMEIPPFIKIVGRDKFVNGKGEMLIKMFSVLNIVNEKGDKINEASLQRFLAEIVWFPSAALSSYVSWSEIDSLSAKATINYKGTIGSGTFYFNEKGDFIKFCAYRYKDNNTDAKRHKWIVNVKDYSVINGIKIPAKVEATWVLEKENWTWLELEITDIRYNKDIEKTSLNNIDHEIMVKVPESELYTRVRGNPKKPLIVNLHGGPGGYSGIDIKLMGPGLEDKFLVAYLDQRGCGKSLPCSDTARLTVKQYIQDLDIVIDSLLARYNKKHVNLMGSSWGGMYGFLYMLSHQEKINSYACIDGKVNSYYQNHSLIDYEIKRANTLLKTNITDSKEREFKFIISELNRIKNSNFAHFHTDVNWMKHEVPPKLGFNAYFADTTKIISFNKVIRDTALMELMRYTEKEYARVGEKAEIVNQAFRNNAAYNNINIEEELAQINTPTVVIQGDQDYVVGLGHAELIYKALRGLSVEHKELHIIPETGHCPAIEEPEILSEILVAFFERFSKDSK